MLGRGGMGAVYAARNLTDGERVAIKWLLPEHAASTMRERLLREACIASSIAHPNVVDIYEVGEHEGGLFLVMEYLHGKPLSELLWERGSLAPELLIALLLPAMRGVHAAHLAGVIHRDLKPENIILSEAGGRIVPKVVDFGVSKLVGPSASAGRSLTQTGMLVGTPHYMAIEQVDGTKEVDARADVYAFGVILYQALTGSLPFDGVNLGAVIVSIATRLPLPPRWLRPELAPELEAIVLRALAREREARYQDLEQLVEALLPFAAPEPLRPTQLQGAAAAPGQRAGEGERAGGRSLSELATACTSGELPAPALGGQPASFWERPPKAAALLYCAAAVLAALASDGLRARSDLAAAALASAAPRASWSARTAHLSVVSVPAARTQEWVASERTRGRAPPTQECSPLDAVGAEAVCRNAELTRGERAPKTRAARPLLAARHTDLRTGAPPGRELAASARARTPRTPLLARIPGRRTNGLRLDEF